MDESPLHRSLADLKPGDHLCFFYASESEHRAVLTLFLQHGLERGEKIIYLTDHHVPDLILSYLEAAGVKPDPYLASGQLRVVELEEVLADLPVPGPEGLLPLLAQEAGQAQAEGFAGLRFTYEMTWAIKNLLGADRLSDYGGKLGEFSRGSA